MSESNERKSAWKTLLFSEMLVNRKAAYRVAYIAVIAAMNIVVNTIMSVLVIADLQFSLTIFMSALSGIIIGPIFGATAAFVGDAVGFLATGAGGAYIPWVGISCAMMALISGFVMNGVKLNFRGAVYVKLAIVAVLIFLICTVGINTTAFYLLFANRGTTGYLAYCFSRLILKGQLLNNLFNYALLYAAVPVLNAVKPLRISIK